MRRDVKVKTSTNIKMLLQENMLIQLKKHIYIYIHVHIHILFRILAFPPHIYYSECTKYPMSFKIPEYRNVQGLAAQK